MEASNNPDQERQDAQNTSNNTSAKDQPASTPTSAGNRQIKRSIQKRKSNKKRKTPTRRMGKRNVVVLWLVAIGLLISMVISFTPTLGNLTGSQLAENPAFFVNDEAITELQVAQARQNPLFGAVTEGEVGDDLELLLVAQLIDNTVLRQAAADTSVSRAEVRQAVEDYRQARGVSGRGNDSAYLQVINNQGFTDETFRDFQREQIRQRKFIELLTEDVTITDTEVEDFYTANQIDYVSDPQLVARQIVVEDEDLANSLQARAVRGEDFATLASETSVELAEVAGAVQADDEGNPQPISRAALPTSVSSAAFGLQGQGITDVVSTGGLFYIIQVLDYLPADVRPFDEVGDQVREDALAAKESAVLQQTLRNLRQEAALAFPEGSEYDFNNEVVATVGEDDVQALELAEATYLNQQVQQFLSPQNAEIVASFFKPSSLEQLIEQKIALQGADTLDATFVGSEGVIARSALNYVANDAEVTEEDLQTYYEANQARFTIPASATTVQLDFDSEDAALDFRNVILEESLDFDALAERTSNEALVYTDLGTVEPGQLDSEIDRYLFGTEAFTAIADDSLLEVSDVIIIENTVENTETPAETPADDSDTVALEADAAADEATADETSVDETSVDEATADETSADSASEDTAEATDTEATDTEEAISEEAVSSEADASEEVDAGDTDTAETAEAAEATAEAEATDTEAVDAASEDTVSNEDETVSETVTETTYTLLVAIRTPERVRSLDEVRAQVRQTVLNTERSDLQQAWLTALRESIPVENFIAENPATVPASSPNVEFTTDPLPDTTEEEASEETTAEDAATDDANDPEATEADDEAEGGTAEGDTADSADDATNTDDPDATGDEPTGEDVDTAPDASEEDSSSTDEEDSSSTDDVTTDEPAEATDENATEDTDPTENADPTENGEDSDASGASNAEDTTEPATATSTDDVDSDAEDTNADEVDTEVSSDSNENGNETSDDTSDEPTDDANTPDSTIDSTTTDDNETNVSDTEEVDEAPAEETDTP